jgi:hypothetical protein
VIGFQKNVWPFQGFDYKMAYNREETQNGPIREAMKGDAL